MTCSTNSGPTSDAGGVSQSYSTRTLLVPCLRAPTALSAFASSTQTQATPAFSLVTVDAFGKGCESESDITRASQSWGCSSRHPTKWPPLCLWSMLWCGCSLNHKKITQFTINSALDLSLKLVLFFLSSNAFSMHAYSSYVGQAGGEVCCFKLVCSFLG